MVDPHRAAEFADDYAESVRDLNDHWHDGTGGCVCGAPVSPCDAEVEAMRKINQAEAVWRAERAAAAARFEIPGTDSRRARPVPATDATS